MKEATLVWNDRSPPTGRRSAAASAGDVSCKTEGRRAPHRPFVGDDRARPNRTDARVLTPDFRTRECLDGTGRVQVWDPTTGTFTQVGTELIDFENTTFLDPATRILWADCIDDRDRWSFCTYDVDSGAFLGRVVSGDKWPYQFHVVP